MLVLVAEHTTPGGPLLHNGENKIAWQVGFVWNGIKVYQCAPLTVLTHPAPFQKSTQSFPEMYD